MRLFEIELTPHWSENCSIALKAFKTTGQFLYRGISKQLDVVQAESKSNRHSRDTDTHIQEFIDNWLKENGFKAFRSNSIFATSNTMEANGYGIPHIIIPEDTCNITWSPVIRDLFNVLNSGNIPAQELRLNAPHRKSLVDQLVNVNYQNGNLARAINSGNEVMISGKYWIFNVKYESMLGDLIANI